ncbi:hypothetical protein BWI17_16690 [Betaproteobacteria bacterium GR16-43]|nr:hypothetical protein BWI17_16690 [Betaproteobacteria bacterium GR16-43]
MATQRGKGKREKRVVLGEDLRIGHARETFESLAAIAPKATVVIDASAVSRVDAAGLQALAACLVQWSTAGTVWRWDNPAHALSAAARTAGLATVLGLE